MSCCVLAFAALFAAPADPPPADTCCLTYGQVQSIIAATGYIPASAVSQCLTDSATKMSAYPTEENKGFLFIPDQTVGLSPAGREPRVICLQWKAVLKKLENKGQVLLLYDGEPVKDADKFHGKMKRGDVVIVVMRLDPKTKVCELAQLHVIPIEKVKPQKGKEKD